MDKPLLKKVYDWYYRPGEFLRSIGFYMNPYKQWDTKGFRHIFAFDGACNLYVGQYSVYHQHIQKMFDLEDRREFGFLYPENSALKPEYSEVEVDECGIELEEPELWDTSEVIMFEFLEHVNITYLNIRLKKMAQRLFDYGMSTDAIVVSNQVDLWQPTIRSILNGKLMKKPDKSWLKKQIST